LEDYSFTHYTGIYILSQYPESHLLNDGGLLLMVYNIYEFHIILVWLFEEER